MPTTPFWHKVTLCGPLLPVHICSSRTVSGLDTRTKLCFSLNRPVEECRDISWRMSGCSIASYSVGDFPTPSRYACMQADLADIYTSMYMYSQTACENRAVPRAFFWSGEGRGILLNQHVVLLARCLVLTELHGFRHAICGVCEQHDRLLLQPQAFRRDTRTHTTFG